MLPDINRDTFRNILLVPWFRGDKIMFALRSSKSHHSLRKYFSPFGYSGAHGTQLTLPFQWYLRHPTVWFLICKYFLVVFSKMPPQGQNSCVLYETDAAAEDKTPTIVAPSAQKRELQIVWRNVAIFAYLHTAAVYGAYLFLTQAKWATCAFGKYIFVFILLFICWIPRNSKYLHVIYLS